MYPRNAASPERIAVGQVVLIADGTIQSAAVVVTVRGQGGAEAGSAGTIAFGADNTVYYTPTQAETNFTSFTVIASKASCFSASVTIVTTASATPGTVESAGTLKTLDALDTAQDLEHAITQDLVGNISSGSAALAQNATGFTATSVAQTLTFAATTEEDGVLHELAPSTGTLDGEYTTTLPDSASVSDVTLFCYVQSNGDSVAFQYWDWTDSSFKTELTFAGSNGTTLIPLVIPATAAYTGTGANLGKIRFRVFSDGGTVVTKVAIDRLRFEYAVVQNSLGFLGGAVWYDNNNGEAGTDTGIGTVSRPSSVIADARTIADANNLKIIHALPGSAIVLGQAFDNFEFIGFGYTLALDGRSISASLILGATVSGIGIGASRPMFKGCELGTLTLVPFIADDCGLSDTITFSAAGDYEITNSHSNIAGSSTPIIDTGAAVGNVNLTMPHYQQGIEIRNLNATGTDLFSISGAGQIIYAASSSGTANQRGDWKVTNTGGLTLLTDDNTTKITEILSDQDSMGITKNAAFSNFEFPMVLTSDHYTAATSKTVTGERSIDGAAFASVAGTIAEVGSGVYQIDLLAADTNGDVITYKFSATDSDDTIITVTTRI